jgi:pentatricopeptide repeat protein
MGGYVGTDEPEKVFRVYKRMIKRNIQPTLSTQIPLLKASASAELDKTGRHGLREATQELTQTEELWKKPLQTSILCS